MYDSIASLSKYGHLVDAVRSPIFFVFTSSEQNKFRFRLPSLKRRLSGNLRDRSETENRIGFVARAGSKSSEMLHHCSSILHVSSSSRFYRTQKKYEKASIFFIYFSMKPSKNAKPFEKFEREFEFFRRKKKHVRFDIQILRTIMQLSRL